MFQITCGENSSFEGKAAFAQSQTVQGAESIYQEDQQAKSSSFHYVGHREQKAVRTPERFRSNRLTVEGSLM